jgi:hypothetical protein
MISLLKKLIKNALGPSWVGFIANRYNKLYRRLSLRFFYKRYPQNRIQTIHYKHSRPDELNPVWVSTHLPVLPELFHKAFREFIDVEQHEFVRCVDNCLIEPKYGWPMTASNELIFECFPYSNQEIVPVPPLNWKGNKKVKNVERVISFREIFDFGYWHVYADVIHKNHLIEKMALDQNIPVVVSKQLAEKSYFQYFHRQIPAFKKRALIVQDDFLLRADEAYFIKPMLHCPEYYQRTSELATGAKGNSALNRKIFLTRDPLRGRYISNSSDVEKIVERFGFEIVDTDLLTIERQIKLFSETRYLVGIHGAGLSNMLFRYPERLSVIEIFPHTKGRFQMPPHYFLMAGALQFDYKPLLGSEFDNHVTKSFRLNVDLLEQAIASLLKE